MKDEPAFPTTVTTEEWSSGTINDSAQCFGNTYSFGGLTKREYFAGQALFAHLWLNRHTQKPDLNLAEMIAMDAVACADALIAELEKAK